MHLWLVSCLVTRRPAPHPLWRYSPIPLPPPTRHPPSHPSHKALNLMKTAPRVHCHSHVSVTSVTRFFRGLTVRFSENCVLAVYLDKTPCHHHASDQTHGSACRFLANVYPKYVSRYWINPKLNIHFYIILAHSRSFTYGGSMQSFVVWYQQDQYLLSIWFNFSGNKMINI